MERNLSQQELDAIYQSVNSILFSKGMKAATMDNVAASLGMSKRTLYEIFGSKDQLIFDTLSYNNRLHIAKIEKIFSECANVLEACIKITLDFAENMRNVSPEFFRDMDHFYRDMRPNYEDLREKRRAKILEVFHKGVRQGVFRPDINYNLYLEMFDLQMEALKRAEGKLPSDISIAEIHVTMMLVSLRGISSSEGIRIFDELLPKFTPEDNKFTSLR
ncbi:MAG: TetR/AcrR family transcriptional regulator [Muribaculum sp.]|nr:TetR/AcrR family transcriptional regulator [Muribaculum sp.]